MQAVVNTQPLEFGLLFDIDGVITRGRTLLPHSKSAFKLITDENGRFLVPTIFVTNAGNSLRQSKAKQLTEWLGVQVLFNAIGLLIYLLVDYQISSFLTFC